MQDNAPVTFDLTAWTSAAFRGFTQYLIDSTPALKRATSALFPVLTFSVILRHFPDITLYISGQ
jgi:hypothetical protein